MPDNFTITDNERGVVATANGRSMFVPVGEGPLAGLREPARNFTRVANETFSSYLPEVARERLRGDLSAPLRKSAAMAIDANRAALRDYERKGEIGLTPPPSVNTDRAAEWRAVWRALDRGEQVRRATKAGAEELAAVIAAPDLAGVAGDALRIVRERAFEVFHAERTGLAGRHPKEPGLNRLTVIGADTEATAKAAREAVQAWAAEGEAVEANEKLLVSMLGYIGSALQLDARQALDAILAA